MISITQVTSTQKIQSVVRQSQQIYYGECVIDPFSLYLGFFKRGLQQSIPFVRDINGSGCCVPIL